MPPEAKQKQKRAGHFFLSLLKDPILSLFLFPFQKEWVEHMMKYTAF